MSKLLIPIVTYLSDKEIFTKGNGLKYLIAANVFATLYCLYWDYVWDWGLCRG
jgi:hypothetical protein